MKPILLNLKNIGPFVGNHTIDFSKLDEIFLICGKTGSGKSTILDAITYALYGSLPGARSARYNIRSFRSDFCNSEDESSVTLTFIYNAEKYKVERILPVLKKRRTGSISENPEKIAVYKDNILIANNKTAANSFLLSLLKLTIEEFSKIVLLPQGEFSDFLRSNSLERKKILEKLFPVSEYTAIIKTLKEETDAKKKEYDFLAKQLENITKTSGKEEIDTEKDLELLENKIDEVHSKIIGLREDLDIIQERKTIIKKELSLYDTLKNIKKEKVTLLQNESSITKKRAVLKKAQEAHSLRAELEQLETSRAREKRELTSCNVYKEKLVLANEKIEMLNSKKDSILKKKEESIALIRKIENIEQALSFQKDLFIYQQREKKFRNNNESYKTSLEAISKQVEELSNSIKKAREAEDKKDALLIKEDAIQKKLEKINFAQEYHRLKKALDNSKKEVEKQTNVYKKAKDNLEELENQKKDAELKNKAIGLALTLKKGEPCPVCGSKEHPQIIKEITLSSDLASLIENQQALLENTKKTLKDAEEKLHKNNALLEQYEKGIGEDTSEFLLVDDKTLSIDRDCQQKKLLEIQDEINKNQSLILKKRTCEKEKEKRETQLSIMTNDFHDNEKKLIAIQERISLSLNQIENLNLEDKNYSETERTLKQKKMLLDEQVESFEALYANEVAEKERISERKTTYEEQNQRAKEEHEKAFMIFTAMKKKTSFVDEKEVKEALISKEEMNTLIDSIQIWEKNRENLDTRFKEIKKSLDKSEESLLSEKEQLTKQEEEKTLKSEQMSSKEKELYTEFHTRKKNKEQKDQFEKESQLIHKELSVLYNLHDAISGKNPQNIPLDSWVLGLFLEKITVFASSRLERISDGRYSMKVCSDKDQKAKGSPQRGLDLEIYDANTGKKRACNTLSGGETFMASISLALAISDTVQARNGGIKIDSLFIDEGFGSLDEASLSKALSILEEIRQTRSIGLISHVGELQQKIPSRIEITKTQLGSSVKVCE